MITHAGLPEFSFGKEEVSGKTILIKRGEVGYYPCPAYEDKDYQVLNKEIGITPAQAEAMIGGSIFGWTCPISNPKFWETEGQPIIEKRYNKVV